jgi:hypothetical protein
MNRFKAITWNMAGGTIDPPTSAEVKEIAQAQAKRGVSLMLLQEAQHQGHDAALIQAGYKIKRFGQYGVAWDNADWMMVDCEKVRLSDHPYFRKGNPNTPVFSESMRAILCDYEGRSLEVISYHTPPTVQKATPAENRMISLRQSMKRLSAIAGDSQAMGFLAGGDDNVDEDGPHGPWGFMLAGETGLRQVEAPRPTHGRVRSIDDFRIPVRGSLRVESGWVSDGGGDHRLHGRLFVWRG